MKRTASFLPSRTWAVLWMVASLSITLVGCGGGGGSTAEAPASNTPAPVTPVAGALSLNLASLANYAAPVLPVYYDAAVLNTDNTPPNNAISDKVATLGRVLFYDKRLSVNDTVACASCHQQAAGFSDPNRFSVGFSGQAFGTAHSMRLGNVRYFRPATMFWDKRTATLELQATQPVQNPVEMGFDTAHGGIGALLPKLQAIELYQELFTFAFGDSTVTEARLQNALAQFEPAMVSTGSRWDTGYAQVFDAALPDKGRSLTVPGLSAQEDRGRALFMGGPGTGVGCAACHVPPTFSLAANSLSNGLDAGETVAFKSPSLKNVAVAGAFMHDGRFSTLEQVVEHYNSGVKLGPALDNRLINGAGQPKVLNLSVAEKAALVAFLKTLTDTGLNSDAKFATPFLAP